MFINPEQDELMGKPKLIKQFTTRRTRRGREKEREIVIMSGSKRTVAVFDKKGKLTKDVFHNDILNKSEITISVKGNKRKIVKHLKEFLKLNPRIRITKFDSKLIFDDTTEELLNENTI